jgi:hypothetical protein
VADVVGDAIALNDLDELLRLAHAFADHGDWDDLVSLAARARRAFDTGRQLWPASNLAEYRLALDAPADYAALVLTDDAGRFGLGPLSEVAASTHTWAELAPHVVPGPVSSLAAHERVVRGERVDASTVAMPEVLGTPLELAPWEPEYFVPVYERDRVEEPGPEPIRGRALELPENAAELVTDIAVEEAVRDLVRPWTVHSDASVRVACVHGEVAHAIAALGVSDVRGAWVDAGEALATLGWAGSSGGRHHRRRGAASGRDLAWVTAGALAGFEPGERLQARAIGEAVSELRWYTWSASDVSSGWILRMAVEDPTDGIAWAIDAVDRDQEKPT